MHTCTQTHDELFDSAWTIDTGASLQKKASFLTPNLTSCSVFGFALFSFPLFFYSIYLLIYLFIIFDAPRDRY